MLVLRVALSLKPTNANEHVEIILLRCTPTFATSGFD